MYLSDVDEEAGPFEYVPRSAPGGELGDLWPWRPLGDNYPPQDELAQRIEGRPVETFTGPKGTMIFCNTSGFHRGGFATGKPRVLATFTYASPAALKSLSDRNFTLARHERRSALAARRGSRSATSGVAQHVGDPVDVALPAELALDGLARAPAERGGAVLVGEQLAERRSRTRPRRRAARAGR